VSSSSGVWGGTATEIEFYAFSFKRRKLVATILIIYFENILIKLANLVQFERMLKYLVWRIGERGLGPICYWYFYTKQEI